MMYMLTSSLWFRYAYTLISMDLARSLIGGPQKSTVYAQARTGQYKHKPNCDNSGFRRSASPPAKSIFDIG